jgi:hypothetical protein
LGTVEPVLLIAAAVVVGLFAGRLLPRLPRHQAGPSVRWWWLLPAGLALALLAERAGGAPAIVLGGIGLGALITLAVRNFHLAGMGILGAGLALNLIAIVVNAGMPVRASALVEAGVVEAGEVDGIELTGYRHLERPGDPFPVIGDVVPLPIGTTVVSLGDLLVAAGAAVAIANLTRRRRLPKHAADERVDLRHWLAPDEVAVASVGDPDLGVEPVWRDDLELLDVDIDLGNRPADPTDPDITVPLRQVQSRLATRPPRPSTTRR